MKRKIREFVKIKKTMRLLQLIAVMLALVLANIIIFGIVLGQPFNFSYAGSVINFGQSIVPANPVKEWSETEKTASTADSFASSKYRIIVPISDEKKSGGSHKPVFPMSQTITFHGTALYPNSQIFLSIQSDPILTSVLSDSQGKWSWTGYGSMLDAGNHLLKTYDISPVEISGKRDVLVGAYSFAVGEQKDGQPSVTVNLDDLSYTEEAAADDVISKKLVGAQANDIFLFDVALINKKTYSPGDEMNLQLMFSSLGESSGTPARVRYEIYAYGSDSQKSDSYASFKDDLSLDKEGAFLKKIRLQEDLISGTYVLKVSSKVSGQNYVQYALFDVSSKPVIQIGGNVITEEKFKRVIAWNVAFLVLFAIIMIVVVLYEFQRFMIFRATDDEDLKKHGALSGRS